MLRLILILLILLTGCQVNRPADQIQNSNAAYLNEVDYRFVFSRIENKIKTAPNRVSDTILEQYLRNLICELSDEYCSEIRIYVLNHHEFNAHMFPNGTLIINTGLLLRMENRAQIAYIISHELAHYVEKHGVQKINFAKSLGSNNQLSALNPLRQINLANSRLWKNRYSQQLEQQADLYALNLLTKKHFDLAEVVRMFENLKRENQAANKVNKGGFFSSHPGTNQRASLFRESATIQLVSRLSKEDEWPEIKSSYTSQWLSAELSKRQFRSTKVLLNQLQTRSSNPDLYDYFWAEIYRKQGGKNNAQTAVAYYTNYLSNSKHTRFNDTFRKLAETYMELGNTSKASFYYLKYINQVPQPNDVDTIKHVLDRLKSS